jgi:ElaB/YqjD/DUF883 family membrane-anchored ribosome-binding protein
MKTLADQPVVRDRISNVVDLFTDRLAGAAKSTDGFVRSNPWQAVGSIALVGLAAGLLVARGARRMRKPASLAGSPSEVTGG